jgi:hypothetical protein
MSKKLSTSNSYLRDPLVRRKALYASAKTSSAIEGIHKPFAAKREDSTGRVVTKVSVISHKRAKSR